MGLFSARGRMPQPAEPRWPIRSHPAEGLAQLAHAIGPLMGRLPRMVRAAARSAGRELLASVRRARLVAVAATNDARVVAVLLLLAAVALGVEMAASFHLI